MSGTTSTRIAWLDVAKGLGLILVVIGHSQSLNKAFPEGHKWVYSFHMPLFFFLTGCTLNLKSSIDLLRRTLTLAIPYLLISMLMLPASLKSGKATTITGTFLGIAYGTGHTIYTVPLWFLTCTASALAFIALIAFFLKSIPKRFLYPVELLLASCLIAIGFFVVSRIDYQIHSNLTWSDLSNAGLPWNLDLIGIAAGYMLMGHCCVKAANALNNVNLPLNVLAMLLVGGISIWVNTAYRVDLDLNFRRLVPLPWSIVNNVVGIGFILYCSFILSRYAVARKLIMPIGQAGIIVLWLHAGLENKVSRNVFQSFFSEETMAFVIASITLATLVPTLIDKFIIKKFWVLNALFYPKLSFMKAAKGSRGG